MRILYLCDENYYKKKMSRVRFHSIEAISKISELKCWGIGWDGYDNSLPVQENINRSNFDPDLVIAYKPLQMLEFNKITFPKCLRYNEMWDFDWTIKEITESGANIVICHHRNDMSPYIEFYGEKIKFVHIPHCAEKTVFKDYNIPKTVDLLLTGKIGFSGRKIYPLRVIEKRILRKMKRRFNCKVFSHPGYRNEDAYTNKYAIEFAKAINSSKIALTCSSKYKYRLGKYSEIAMCGTVIGADIPGQDEDEFEKFVINIDTSMKDKEIINKLTYYLENPDELSKKQQLGLKWAENYTQERYAHDFIEEVKKIL